MNSKYLFSDSYVGFSKNKIHFLRNNFEYDLISSDKIESVYLKRGKSISNWLLLLFIGLLFIGISIYLLLGVIYFFLYSEYGRIYIEQLIAPIMFILIGIYMLYKSLITEQILEIKFGNKKEKFSINEFKKQGVLDELLLYLSETYRFENKIGNKK